MKKTIFAFSLLILPQLSLADFIYTQCSRWTSEGWTAFTCSNEKSYVVGNAICTTTDSRRNGNKNTSHGPQSEEIFCRFKYREDVQNCLNDSGPEIEECYTEYKRNRDNKPSAAEKKSGTGKP